MAVAPFDIEAIRQWAEVHRVMPSDELDRARVWEQLIEDVLACADRIDELEGEASAALAALREQAERAERKPLRSFAQWIVALDEPDATERRTVTMTQIIEGARNALASADSEGKTSQEAWGTDENGIVGSGYGGKA